MYQSDGMSSAWMLSHFIATNMFHRDAAVTMQFVQSLLESLPLSAYVGDRPGFSSPVTYAALFDRQRSAHVTAVFEALFQGVRLMSDVVRTSVYAPDGTRIWSTNPRQVGIRNLANAKLVKALAGELAVSPDVTVWDMTEAERARVPRGTQFFSEMYMPMWDAQRQTVVGVVKSTRHLMRCWTPLPEGNGGLGVGLLVVASSCMAFSWGLFSVRRG